MAARPAGPRRARVPSRRRASTASTALAGLVALCAIAACSDDGTAPATSGSTGPATTVVTSAPSTAAPATSTTVVASTTTAPTASSSSAVTPPPTAATSAPTTTVATTTVPIGSTGDGTGAAIGEPAADLQDATSLTVRPGDAATAYVTTQEGRVWAWVPGGEPRQVLDLRERVRSGGEQGLLGLAFAADGEHAYVNYSGADDGGDTHVDEFAVAADGGFDAGSRRELLVIPQPYRNHNGGQLAVGPDGMLYVGMGDGGSSGDPERRALDLGELLGKILRIDPTPGAGGEPYTVPADNPFTGTDGARPEIWSQGLRNPWRFSFDPATGDLWIADVGQNEWEEIDLAPATGGRDAGRGLNFGWSALEGTHPYNDDQSPDGATAPFFEYGHDEGCSVSGGEVYRGGAVPGLAGWYVFSDYCEGTVWALQVVAGPDGAPAAGERVEIGDADSVSAVELGPGGELYVLSQRDGILPVVRA